MSQSNSDLTEINVNRLFLIGVTALFTTSLSFSLRVGLAKDIQNQVFALSDPTSAAGLIGTALAVAFLSSSITILIVSAFLDKIGMRRTLTVAGIMMTLGSFVVASGHWVAPEWSYRTIWIGMILSGIGWGCTEGTINPMTTAIYPDDKINRLNVLHAWWPAGIIVGALSGYVIDLQDIAWYQAILLPVIPALTYLVLLRGQKFPRTATAKMGVTVPQMIYEIFRSPSFLIWFGIMVLAVSTEFVPSNWVDISLTKIVPVHGLLILAFVSGIMFVMRYFAGSIAHRISALGLMFLSSVFALVGLWLLPQATTALSALVAAGLWGMGVCFMWPTMMAIVADRYPRSGAWGIGLIASAGGVAVYAILPLIGGLYDTALAQAAGGKEKIATLSAAESTAAHFKAATSSFEVVAYLPAALVVIFGLVLLLEKFTSLRVAAKD
jgi:MFS family permease